MKALLLTEYKQLEYTDMPEPEIGEGDLLVRVNSCGVCGSDVHGFDGSSGRRIPPLIMGHEAAGVVESVGARVSDFTAGDRVTFDSTVSCGDCFFCHSGRINLCDNRMVLGVSCEDYRRHGAFAEYVAIPQQIAYKLPEDLPFEQAALVEAVSVAVHAVNQTRLPLGASVAAVGAGMIGLLTIQAIRAAGAGKIIAIDLVDERLQTAAELGADQTINASQADAVEAVHAATAGRGADCVFEVVGAGATVNTAINAARKGGHVTLVGNLTPKVDIPLQAVVTRELTLHGSCASSGEYPACLDLMARGAIDVTPLISAAVPLSEGAAWFDRLYAGEQGLLKVILQP